MFKKINKVPAGMFLIPLVVSLVLVSIFPNMYDAIGGTTQQTFQMGTNVVIGLLVFSAGTSLDLKQIVPLIKRHLPIILFKLVISTIYILVFYWLFGLDGIFGINLLAFACVIYSLNPAVALAIHSSYGDKQFGAVYGIMGLIGMPFAPLILLSILTADGGAAGIDWQPIISIFVPLVAGTILGNLDKDFTDFFVPMIGRLLPFLGWNLGAAMNIQSAIAAGLPGILMAGIFMVLLLPLIPFDRYIMKQNAGVDGAAIWNVAGMSVANPASIASALPLVFADQSASATAIVMMVCIITSIISPIVAQKLYVKEYGIQSL